MHCKAKKNEFETVNESAVLQASTRELDTLSVNVAKNHLLSQEQVT